MPSASRCVSLRPTSSGGEGVWSGKTGNDFPCEGERDGNLVKHPVTSRSRSRQSGFDPQVFPEGRCPVARCRS